MSRAGVLAAVVLAAGVGASEYEECKRAVDAAWDLGRDKQFDKVWGRDGQCAPYSTLTAREKFEVTLDHVVSRTTACEEGLKREEWDRFAIDPDNLVLAYSSVNSSKQDKRIADWLGTNRYSKNTNKQWALCRENLILDRYELKKVETCDEAVLDRKPVCQPVAVWRTRYVPVRQ